MSLIQVLDVKSIIVSAPGKALLAGGYLVLESPNVGVTVATSSRFYAKIENVNSIVPGIAKIVVNSPQFGTFYNYSCNNEGVVTVEGQESNSFIEKCLKLSITFIRRYLTTEKFYGILEQGDLSIVLLAHNDFYSQIKFLRQSNLPLLSASLKMLEQFKPCPIGADGKADIAKTGLGSSAALTTSLIGAILQHFGVIDLANNESTDRDRVIVHNLAQLVHANAQGKIGSGFDVSAAVYGTQVYSRFSDTPFVACLEENVSSDTLYDAVMASTNIEKGIWNQQIIPFSLPYGIDMILGDVCGGTSSTSMAKEVLKWKKSDTVNSQRIWNTLAVTNREIYETFQKLSNIHKNDAMSYKTGIDWASTRQYDEWKTKLDNETVQLLVELRQKFTLLRQYMKEMGTLAGVEIEPDSQSELADATSNIPGVICAAIPGAGGVDALFALTLSSHVRDQVERLWSTWHTWGSNHSYVCPLVLNSDAGNNPGISLHHKL